MGAVLAGSAVPSVAATAGTRGPCTASQTRALVSTLTRAWSRGDVATIERVVVGEPLFRWVSVAWAGNRTGRRAFIRSTVAAYFAARHRQHERVVLRSFRFNGSDIRGEHGYGHFELTVRLTADDWPEGLDRLRPGKGAIVCTLPRPGIAVLSIG